MFYVMSKMVAPFTHKKQHFLKLSVFPYSKKKKGTIEVKLKYVYKIKQINITQKRNNISLILFNINFKAFLVV